MARRAAIAVAMLAVGAALLLAWHYQRAESPGGRFLPAGCSVFPADNIWNTAIRDLPLDARSAAYIATMGARSSRCTRISACVCAPSTASRITWRTRALHKWTSLSPAAATRGRTAFPPT